MKGKVTLLFGIESLVGETFDVRYPTSMRWMMKQLLSVVGMSRLF